MELHSPAVGKKLWSYLRVAFFMMRKGLISKRRLMIMDLNLMMKRGKLLGKSLGKNLAFHHHHSSSSSSSSSRTRSAPPHGSFGFGLQEYEFSCSNSPMPVNFPRVGAGSTSKRRHNYFPCISSSTGAADEADVVDSVGTPGPVTATPKIEYSPQCSYLSSYDLAPGEKLSPLPSPAPFSSIRISNYSSEDNADEEGGPAEAGQVDDEAEEFIRRFYEQLRAQSRIGLLEYQEREYREMLARGT